MVKNVTIVFCEGCGREGVGDITCTENGVNIDSDKQKR